MDNASTIKLKCLVEKIEWKILKAQNIIIFPVDLVMEQPKKRQKRLTKYSAESHKEHPCIKACSSSVKDTQSHADTCIYHVNGNVYLFIIIIIIIFYLGNLQIDQLIEKEKSEPAIVSETKMVMLLIQHNTTTYHHLCLLIRNEFKGSEVAQSFSCSRTKTAAIVNCLGDHFLKLKSDMQNMPYSLMLDVSNDNGIQKMFPITVRIFDETFSRIMTKFFDMNLLEGRDASTADVMFESVDNVLATNDIQWDHWIAIGLDNTNVNIGEHNSIKSHAKEKNEDIIIVGCPCHILHNASAKAAMAFLEVTGFDVEDHCVDLFY